MQEVLVTRTLAISPAYRRRWQRAEILRAIAADRVHAGAVVMWPPSFAMTMATVSVIAAVPGIGHDQAVAVLRASDVDETAQLRELSQRDRIRIVQTLRSEYPLLWQLASPSPPERSSA